MDISTGFFVFGFVFSSLILLTLGVRDVLRDVRQWRDARESPDIDKAAAVSKTQWLYQETRLPRVQQ